MKNTLHFTLVTTSPLHLAYPDNAQKMNDGSNVALTLKKQIKGKDVPYFQANGLRGALRRHAAKRIADFVAQTQAPLPADVYTGLNCGASSGRPDASGNSVEEMVRASNHAYMGLFGGGSRIFSSRYKVSDINIICNHTVENFIVNAPKSMIEELLADQTYKSGDETKPLEPYQFLARHFFTRVDDFGRGTNLKALDKVIENGLEGVKEFMLKNADSDKKRKDDAEAKKDSLSTLLNFEAIKSSVPMHFRMDLSPDITEAQVGVLLNALTDMFNENYIGGWGRSGFGTYRITGAQLDLHGERMSQSDGFYDGDDFSFGASFSGLTSEGVNAIEAMQRDELIGFFQNIKKEK